MTSFLKALSNITIDVGADRRHSTTTTERQSVDEAQSLGPQAQRQADDAQSLVAAVRDMVTVFHQLVSKSEARARVPPGPGGGKVARYHDVTDQVLPTPKPAGCCNAGKQLPLYRDDLTIVQYLLSWHGTILPLVLTKPAWWILVGVHGAFIIAIHHGNQPWPDITTTTVTVPTTLYIFFVVFYASQCYARFFDMYGHTICIGGATMNWVAMVKLHMAGAGEAAQWNAVRYFLAASHVLYFLLSGADGMVCEEEWAIITGRQLISQEELARVQSYRGMKPFLLITWGLQEVQAFLHPADDGGLQSRETGQMRAFQQIAFDMRGHMGQLVNLLAQPVPWAYFHLLNCLQFFVLLVFAFGIIERGARGAITER